MLSHSRVISPAKLFITLFYQDKKKDEKPWSSNKFGNATSSLPDIERPGHFAPQFFLESKLMVGLGVGFGSWVRVRVRFRVRFRVMVCVRGRDRARGRVKVRGCSMSRRLDVAHSISSAKLFITSILSG